MTDETVGTTNERAATRTCICGNPVPVDAVCGQCGSTEVLPTSANANPTPPTIDGPLAMEPIGVTAAQRQARVDGEGTFRKTSCPHLSLNLSKAPSEYSCSGCGELLNVVSDEPEHPALPSFPPFPDLEPAPAFDAAAIAKETLKGFGLSEDDLRLAIERIKQKNKSPEERIKADLLDLGFSEEDANIAIEGAHAHLAATRAAAARTSEQ